MTRDSLEFLFYPKSIAIVGASENPASAGYDYVNYMLNSGYHGAIFPINPKRTEILGLKAYHNLTSVDSDVDYVICCIPIDSVPKLLIECHQKRVKVVHIFSGRGSETGRPEAEKLEVEILERARHYGIRLVGPNCMGVFCPKSGLSFGYDFPRESGTVGAIMQSGGNSTDLVRFASMRGIRFSKVVSYGNGLDVNETDLLEYFAHDSETKVVLCYLEGLKGDSKSFLRSVVGVSGSKPVVICKGGRTQTGVRSVRSHTASLAGSAKLWETAIRQVGAVPVRDVDSLINMAVAFCLVSPPAGRRVGLGGGGGGRNVLSADEWEENGFEVIPLPQDIRDEFKRRGSQLWDWIDNPADLSILVPQDPCSVPAVLAEMARHKDFDLIVGIVAESHPAGREVVERDLTEDVEAYIKVKRECTRPFIVILSNRPVGIRQIDDWRYRTYARFRTRLVEEKVAFFPTVDEAAKAVDELIGYYRRNRQAKDTSAE